MVNKDDAFDFVLDKIAKEALRKLTLNPDEPSYVFAVGRILMAFCGPNTDDFIAERTLHRVQQAGFSLTAEEITQLVQQCREKCMKHQFALENAFNDIEEYDCSGEEAFRHVSGFLARA